MTRRRGIALALKLEVALRQLGLDPSKAELDHTPALVHRKRTAQGGYIPDELDPAYLVWRDYAVHAVKTFGPGAEKRVTTRGGDIGDAAHYREVTEKEQAFRARLLAKAEGTNPVSKPRKGRKMQGRQFQKRQRPMRRHSVEEDSAAQQSVEQSEAAK